MTDWNPPKDRDESKTNRDESKTNRIDRCFSLTSNTADDILVGVKETTNENKVICGRTFDERKRIVDEVAAMSEETGLRLMMIGVGDEQNALAAAVIGHDMETNAVIYDYLKLVEAFMEWNDWTEQEAIDWIDYNVIGSLGNASDGKTMIAPRISMEFDVGEEEENE